MQYKDAGKGTAIETLSHHMDKGRVLTSESEDFVGAYISGYLHLDAPGTYRFQVTNNDGVRLHLGGARIYDDPLHHCLTFAGQLLFVLRGLRFLVDDTVNGVEKCACPIQQRLIRLRGQLQLPLDPSDDRLLHLLDPVIETGAFVRLDVVDSLVGNQHCLTDPLQPLVRQLRCHVVGRKQLGFEPCQGIVAMASHVFQINVLDRDRNTTQRGVFVLLDDCLVGLEGKLNHALLKRYHRVVLPDSLPFGKDDQPSFGINQELFRHHEGRAVGRPPNDGISPHSLHEPTRDGRLLESLHGGQVVVVVAEKLREMQDDIGLESPE